MINILCLNIHKLWWLKRLPKYIMDNEMIMSYFSRMYQWTVLFIWAARPWKAGRQVGISRAVIAPPHCAKPVIEVRVDLILSLDFLDVDHNLMTSLIISIFGEAIPTQVSR